MRRSSRLTESSREGHLASVRSQILSRHLRVVDEDRVAYPKGVVRPATRADCLDGGANAVRPCPYTSCRHHLFVDVTKSGSVSLPWRDAEVDSLEETCSLDVAERGGMTLEDVGKLMNVTRERIRQLEEKVLRRLSKDPMTRFLVGGARPAARAGEAAVTAVRRRLPIAPEPPESEDELDADEEDEAQQAALARLEERAALAL
jgi:sigma-70-like protein